jgi:hypothetical protein
MTYTQKKKNGGPGKSKQSLHFEEERKVCDAFQSIIDRDVLWMPKDQKQSIKTKKIKKYIMN